LLASGPRPSRPCPTNRLRPGTCATRPASSLSRTTFSTSRTNCGHGRVHAAPAFPSADLHESSSVSEEVSVAFGAGTHVHDGLDASSKPWRTSTSFTPLCGRNLRRARCTKLRSELLLRRSGREIPFPAPALRDVRRLESETREAFRFLDLASRRSLLLRTRICQMHARSGFLVADPPLLFVRRNVKFIHPMRNCITNYVLCENISPIRTKNYALT